MTKNLCKIILILFGLVFIQITALDSLWSYPGQDAESLVKQVSEKMESYPEFKNWKALLISKTTKMSGRWQPKETLLIKKEVQVVNGERTEKILEALVTKKGKTKDKTQKYIKDARKEREKAERKKRKQKEKGKNEKDEDKKSLSMSYDDMFPFDEERRDKYIFSRLPDTQVGGKTLHILVSQAKEKGEKFWEGKYYIDPESFTILHIDLNPSKNPKRVKELRMQMEFEENPQGYFIFKKIRMKIDAGIFIKHIRMLVEDDYTNFEILE
jgi:hypothetical protein